MGFENELTARIAGFLEGIGLEVRAVPLGAGTFLPGIAVRACVLHVDEARLAFPGDLLHEAGHLALLAPDERRHASDDVEHEGPEVAETAVMAWTWAAVQYLGLDPAVVFHDEGYRGHSRALVRNFEWGVYLGLEPLVRWGMTAWGPEAPTPHYPHMLRWTRI